NLESLRNDLDEVSLDTLHFDQRSSGELNVFDESTENDEQVLDGRAWRRRREKLLSRDSEL
ncbi:MAG: hypothetical protein MHM6MM_007602, partial [Cercozoa sp. M6MM]